MADMNEKMDGAPVGPMGRSILVQWMLGTSLAWGLAGAANQILSSRSDEISVICVGWMLSGLLQSAVIRQHANWSGQWVLASLAAAPVVAFILVLNLSSADVGAGVALFGTVFSIPQWWVLKGHATRAGWWVPVCTLGWILAGFLSGAFDGGIAGWTAIGVVYGAVTGIAYVWIGRITLNSKPIDPS